MGSNGNGTLFPMALNLYREHNGDCIQKYPVRSHSRKPEEAPSRKWKRCDCWIYASGTKSDGFKRRNTKKSTWPEAEAVANVWEQADSWDAPSTPRIVTKAEPAKKDPLTSEIAHEMEAFFLDSTDRDPPLEPATLRQHKTFKKLFLDFCHSKGYVVTGQLKPRTDTTEGDFKLFYKSWKGGVRSKGNKLGKLRTLGKFLLKRKSITPELAEEIADIKTPFGASSGADRVPFSDDEMERIYAACDKLGTVTWTNQLGTFSYTGEDMKDFIILAVHTGLRISDLATFDAKRRFRRDNHIFLRMQKSKKELNTWVPDFVQERLNDRERRFGSKLFKTGQSEKLETVTDTWRKRLKQVFDLAGPFETTPIAPPNP
jgi:integrase